MAIHRIISIRDGKAGIFMKPSVGLHLGAILRDWEQVVNAPESLFGKFPEDFTLCELGTFDDETGEVLPHKNPIQHSTAREVQKTSPAQGTLRAAQ